MALSQKKRLQKKERKQSKRKRAKESMRAGSGSVSPHTLPIIQCVVSSEIWDAGVGSAYIVRQSPNGSLYVGCYLLDVWALGVKDAFVREIHPEALDFMLSRHSVTEHKAPYVKALIEGAARYARTELGIEPRFDEKSKRYIANIRYSPEDYSFTFGRDGEPLVLIGSERDEAIVSQLVVADSID